MKMLEVQELRVVERGLSGSISPATLLSSGAARVEASYSRVTGKRGAIILPVSFGTKQDRQVAGIELKQAGLVADMAYSCRSSSNSWHRIRTWYA